MQKKILMLGTRGIPSAHGGFETFVQRLALYLVDRGWDVTVYCQNTSKDRVVEQVWRGINLIQIPVAKNTALGSIIFDFKSTIHALQREGLVMVFGYNTGLFSLFYLLTSRLSIMNMDGLEWRRGKWNALQKAWLLINERFGAWCSNFLIADHPEIKNYLVSYIEPSKITVVPYHTEPVINPNEELLKPYGVCAGEYALVIARPEPENSILEIVSAFSVQPRGYQLMVLGKYTPQTCPYHQQVMDAASEEVIFPGAIYGKEVVNALRAHARLYLHGHTVGGTNPSLVEALAAGSPILAQDNKFNRWVAGDKSHYFQDAIDCQQQLDLLLDNEAELQKMKTAAINQYRKMFADDRDLVLYEQLIKSTLKSQDIILGQELSN